MCVVLSTGNGLAGRPLAIAQDGDGKYQAITSFNVAKDDGIINQDATPPPLIPFLRERSRVRQASRNSVLHP